jgi:hypothetical protein
MKTVIVGGGRGCLAILELLDAGHLQELKMEAVCVVDSYPEAPGAYGSSTTCRPAFSGT